MSDRIGHYEYIAELGKGGMGRVVLARNVTTQQPVAIKFIHQELVKAPQVRERFHREVRILKSLSQHRHILPVIDQGEERGIPYFVMPYVQGVSLRERLQTAPLKLAEAASIVEDIGDALSYAHQLGILHRDIKPGNILLDANGRAYLTDFGIASNASLSDEPLTRTWEVSSLGSPPYMAPEMIHGIDASISSEVYSLGVTVYEMLTGTPHAQAMFAGGDLWQAIPKAVRPVLQCATRHAPSERYADVKDFQNAFVAAAGKSARPLLQLPNLANLPNPITNPFPKTNGTSSASKSGGTPLPPPQTQRKPDMPLGLLASLVVILLLMVGVVAALMMSSDGQSFIPTAAALNPSSEGSLALTATQEALSITGTYEEAIAVPITQTQEAALQSTLEHQQAATEVVLELTAIPLTATRIAEQTAEAAAATATRIAQATANAEVLAAGRYPVGTTLYVVEDEVGLFASVSADTPTSRLSSGTSVVVSSGPGGSNQYYDQGTSTYYLVYAASARQTGWMNSRYLSRTASGSTNTGSRNPTTPARSGTNAQPTSARPNDPTPPPVIPPTTAGGYTIDTTITPLSFPQGGG